MGRRVHIHVHVGDAWGESKHPRGQPGNAGEFSSGSGSGSAARNKGAATWQGAPASISEKDALKALEEFPTIPDENRWFNAGGISKFGPEISTRALGLRKGNAIVGMKEDAKSVDGVIPLDMIENTQPSVTVSKVKDYIQNPPDEPIDVVGWRRSEDEPWRFISASGTHRMAAAKFRGVERVPVRFQVWPHSGSRNVASKTAAKKFLKDRGFG